MTPLSDSCQEILIPTAIRYVSEFYMTDLEDLELVTDPNAVKFGNDILDNYLIRI